MELTPKLLAAADMCSKGEEVNLDELAFLLQYAADELGKRPHSGEEQHALLTAFRKRLLARCELLDRPESERATIRAANLEQMIEIEEKLDALLQQRFPASALSEARPTPSAAGHFPAENFRSGRHTYAHVISAEGGDVPAAASTVQKDLSSGLDSTSNKDAAKAVGKAVAERAVEAGVKDVAFDRSGYPYHGRIKELADAAREAGLNF